MAQHVCDLPAPVPPRPRLVTELHTEARKTFWTCPCGLTWRLNPVVLRWYRVPGEAFELKPRGWHS